MSEGWIILGAIVAYGTVCALGLSRLGLSDGWVSALATVCVATVVVTLMTFYVVHGLSCFGAGVRYGECADPRDPAYLAHLLLPAPCVALLWVVGRNAQDPTSRVLACLGVVTVGFVLAITYANLLV